MREPARLTRSKIPVFCPIFMNIFLRGFDTTMHPSPFAGERYSKMIKMPILRLIVAVEQWAGIRGLGDFFLIFIPKSPNP
jgi:hypothetical protein